MNLLRTEDTLRNSKYEASLIEHLYMLEVNRCLEHHKELLSKTVLEVFLKELVTLVIVKQDQKAAVSLKAISL